MSFSEPQPFHANYDPGEVQDMKNLMASAMLPSQAPIDVRNPWDLGMDIDYLRMLKRSFETDWCWDALSKKMAMFPNFVVHYEDGQHSLSLHYIYAKSTREDAIPLLLLHGWPGEYRNRNTRFDKSLTLVCSGTFLDFHKVIEPLTNPNDSKTPA